MKPFSIFIFMVCMMVAITGFSSTITNSYTFSYPSVEKEAEFDRIFLDDCRIISNAGEPALPRRGISLLLPAGEEATDVIIIAGEKVQLNGQFNIIPFQKEYPLSYGENIEFTQPDPAIYNSNQPYPATLYENLSTHFYRGHGVAFVTICPFEYHPKTGDLFYYPNLTVEINTQATAKASSAQSLLRTDSGTNAHLRALVENPTDVISFYGETQLQTREGQYDYLIITDDNLLEPVQELANYKNQCGIITQVALIDDILAEYTGQDDAEKIRNFIINEYENNGIEYVLLAGDADGNGGAGQILAHRGFYAVVNNDPDYDIPADIYFSHLDGSWDNDGDNHWGESGEDDLLGEVYIGRFAADNATEMENCVHKTIMYQSQPVVEDIETGLMVGEDLGWTPWGKDYKEEIHLGSNSWGYTTEGFSDNFDVQTLYDADAIWSPLGDLMPLFNSGINLTNHLGHCNTTYALKFYDNQITDNNCTNDGINNGYNIIYSQGCYCGAYDNRTTTVGNYTNDCITEKWTVIEHGAVAYISNSRYGWGNGSNTNGSSQYYDRQFFDAIFGENMSVIGRVQQDSKEDNIPYINSGANRWVHYECNLLGDPTLDIWTATPTNLAADHNGVYIIGTGEFEITVTDDEGDPIENALVALSVENECVGKGYTDDDGYLMIQFFGDVEEMGTMDMMITGHNLMPYGEQLDIIAPEGPYLVYEEVAIDDTESGNSDFNIDFGETVNLWITLENVGADTAYAVYGELYSTDEYVQISQFTQIYGDIPAGEVYQPEGSYVISVSPDCPDEHQIELQLMIYATNYPENWMKTFTVTTQAPIIDYHYSEIDDSYGNDDGGIDPGETVEMFVHAQNLGTGEVGSITANLSTTDEYITIEQNQAQIDTMPSGISSPLLPTYVITASSDCPEAHLANLTFTFESASGYTNSRTIPLLIGGFIDTIEDGEGGWTHYAGSDMDDDWHRSNARNHTFAGSHSWKCGDTGAGNYSDLLDANLEMPPMEIGNNFVLRFWQWIDSEISGSYPGYAYDGGRVEISTDDGATWDVIEPITDYPYKIRVGGTPGPFEAESPCFAGISDWHEVEFSLADYANTTASIRFRFGSDGASNGEGWYIDDVQVSTYSMYPYPMGLSAEVSETSAYLSWEAPYYAQPLGYNIYRKVSQGAQWGNPENEELLTTPEYNDTFGYPGLTYYYTVTCVYDVDGEEMESQYSNIVDIVWGATAIHDGEIAAPKKFALHQNYPNPFNPTTQIMFSLPAQEKVSLKIYNTQGSLVKTLVDEIIEPGYHSVIWDGKDDTGKTVNSGLYIYSIESDNFNQAKRMMLLK